MGRSGLGAGLAIAALAMSGCGLVSTPDATPSAEVTVDRPAPTSSSAPTRAHGGGPQGVDPADDGSRTPLRPDFPLTIRRTGGIAEFTDTITLRADGRINVETRSVHERTCTLERQQQVVLVAALGTLDLGGDSSTGVSNPPADGSPGIGGTGGSSGSGSDTSQIVITVVDARGRSVNLAEPSLASVLTMVTSLVSDVTLSQPSTRCTPGTATPSGS